MSSLPPAGPHAALAQLLLLLLLLFVFISQAVAQFAQLANSAGNAVI